jgi:predicted ATPase
VGRKQVVRQVVAKLVETRLVTLTGPGSVGKTSVAVATARALLPAFAGAVYFLDPSAAVSPQAALGITGHAALASAIHLGPVRQ